MRRFRDYYRQFEELAPEEASLELRARREEERRRALSRVEPLDLAGTAWHEPPHPEAVNAATFALRRALNAYPDPAVAGAREAVAARHAVAPERVVLGHGAGELLRAAAHALLAGGGDALIAWPAWQRLPALVEAAGGRPVPVPLGGDGAPDVGALLRAAAAPTRPAPRGDGVPTSHSPTHDHRVSDRAPMTGPMSHSPTHDERASCRAAPTSPAGDDRVSNRAPMTGSMSHSPTGDERASDRAPMSGPTSHSPRGDERVSDRAPMTGPTSPPGVESVRAIFACSPNDPTGGSLSRRAVRDLCAGVPAGVTVVLDEALAEFRPDGEDAAALAGELDNLLVVRSFSKAHAMAGLRAAAALGPPELVERLAPSGGVGAPVQAAVAWAASGAGAALAARRRATAAAAHQRLASALAGSALSAAPGEAPFAWLSSTEEDGPALAARLAARQVFVAPGRLWGEERHVRAALRGPEAVDRLAGALLAG